MEARSIERKRLMIEKVRKDSSTVEEEVENEVEEEDESGGGGGDVGLTEEEKKRGVGGNGRRGSSGGGGVSPPSCQAERCRADLTDAKRYHRRHKVCEFHSKAPVVVVAGLRQRFCQQCSRFHDLAEFDEAKRSCRRDAWPDTMNGAGKVIPKRAMRAAATATLRKAPAGLLMRGEEFR